MIKSMTGFGRCEYQQDSRKFTAELKSVNHRYLDVNIRMPKKLNFFDGAIRTLLKNYASRGKIDIFIMYEDVSEAQGSLKYNAALAGEYVKYLRQMAEEFGLDDHLSLTTLARCPDVLTMEEQSVDEEELWKGLRIVLEGAFAQFVSARTTEGENLKKDILAKLSGMEVVIAGIEEHSPEIAVQYRAKLEEKVRELLGEEPHFPYARYAGGVRGDRPEAGFYRTGDEPGGKHDPVQGQRPGDLEPGDQLKD